MPMCILGYDLISYGEIGLPYFELRLRAQILDLIAESSCDWTNSASGTPG
jgi:hypothetical protein